MEKVVSIATQKKTQLGECLSYVVTSLTYYFCLLFQVNREYISNWQGCQTTFLMTEGKGPEFKELDLWEIQMTEDKPINETNTTSIHALKSNLAKLRKVDTDEK